MWKQKQSKVKRRAQGHTAGKMEPTFPPGQPDTTACALNHGSTWPSNEGQITTVKQTTQRRYLGVRHALLLLPLDLDTCYFLCLNTFLPPLPNLLLFSFWILTFGKYHFLRDTSLPSPDPPDPFTNSCYMAFLQGTYHTSVTYLMILCVSSQLSLRPEMLRVTDISVLLSAQSTTST